MKPQRIQLSRKRGWRMPPDTVKVDRSTRWGNPWKVGGNYIIFGGKPMVEHKVLTHQDAVTYFRNATAKLSADAFTNIRAKLGGKNLACWCPLDKPCHADVLLEIANREEK